MQSAKPTVFVARPRVLADLVLFAARTSIQPVFPFARKHCNHQKVRSLLGLPPDIDQLGSRRYLFRRFRRWVNRDVQFVIQDGAEWVLLDVRVRRSPCAVTSEEASLQRRLAAIRVATSF